MAENRFAAFKNEYEELRDYLLKQAGTVIRDRKNFDTDELIGMAAVLGIKVNGFMNSAMSLIEWEEEMLSKIITCEEEAYKERSEIRKYLVHLDTKLDGVNEKLDKAQEEKSEKKEKQEKK